MAESNSAVAADVKPAQQQITVVLRKQDASETKFKIKRSTPFSKVTATWYQREGVASGSYKFLYEGRDIKDTDTAESMDMEVDDNGEVVVDAMLGQTGGAQRQLQYNEH